jgi:hypothetical protein
MQKLIETIHTLCQQLASETGTRVITWHPGRVTMQVPSNADIDRLAKVLDARLESKTYRGSAWFEVNADVAGIEVSVMGPHTKVEA